jgi:excisionase family DNA binding protein
MDILTTKDAAVRLGVSQRRVNALIQSGKLPAQSFGGSWMINESDLALVADRRPGRPPKAAVEASPASKRRKRAAKPAKKARRKGAVK